MPGDPEECREHAKHCLELAKQAASPLAKAQFEVSRPNMDAPRRRYRSY